MKKVFNWLKRYHKEILAFATILMMGAGIPPTVMRGKAFVAAIQYERMAEASPCHAIIKEIEANYNVYIPNIEANEMYAVAWILPQGEIENPPGFIYDLFRALNERFPNRKAYYIVVAGALPIKGVDGECTVIRGVAEYGVTQDGMKKLLGWGKANAGNSLDLLFGAHEFWAVPYMHDAPYLSVLLPREAGHMPPWAKE